MRKIWQVYSTGMGLKRITGQLTLGQEELISLFMPPTIGESRMEIMETRIMLLWLRKNPMGLMLIRSEMAASV